MVEIHCDKCGKNVKIPDTLAGKLSVGTLAGKIFNCPTCGTQLTVPADAASAAGPAPIISFKCRECGEPINVPAEYAGKKGQCATCGAENTVPLPGQQLAEKIARELADENVGATKPSPQSPGDREIPDMIALRRKRTLMSLLTPKAWIALGAILLIFVIIALFVTKDNWETDNRDKIVDSYRQAISYRDNKWYDQACTKYQAILDMVGQRRLKDPQLVDIVNSIKRDLPELRIKQESVSRQRNAKLKSKETLIQAKQEADKLAEEKNFVAAAEKYQEVLAMIPQLGEDMPDLTAFVLEVATAKRKVQEEISHQQIEDRKKDQQLLSGRQVFPDSQNLTDRQKLMLQIAGFIEYGELIDQIVADIDSQHNPTPEKSPPNQTNDPQPIPPTTSAKSELPPKTIEHAAVAAVSRQDAVPMKRTMASSTGMRSVDTRVIIDTRPAPADMPTSREIALPIHENPTSPVTRTPDADRTSTPIAKRPDSTPTDNANQPETTIVNNSNGDKTVSGFLKNASEFAAICKNAAAMSPDKIDSLPAMAKSLSELGTKIVAPLPDKNLTKQQADEIAKLAAEIVADAAAIDRSMQLIGKLSQDIVSSTIAKSTGLPMIQKSLQTTEKFRKSLDQRIAELQKIAKEN